MLFDLNALITGIVKCTKSHYSTPITF